MQMTEETVSRLQAAKAEVSEWLSSVKVGRYGIGRVDKRITQYIQGVARHPEGHNLWEQLAVRRFLRMVDKYGLNRGEVQRFFYFYEHLKFPGKKGDRCYELTPVQAFQFASIFGFWSKGRRVVREVCLFVPRKYSKTTSTAALAVWDLLFGDSNAEAYVGANSQDQAHKCFDVIRGCVKHLDPSGLRYRVNEEAIKSKRKDRTAEARCLTAGARTKDGLNASTVIMDEFSQAKDNQLLTVLTTSMGVRDNPLTVIITTASDVFEGPFYEMLDGYKSMLLGDVEDDTVFAHLFEPDLGDAEDDPATWRKVHPHLGVTVAKDFYQQEWVKAQRQGAQAMLAFRTKLLNVYAENQRKSWISATEIRKVMRRIDPRRMSRRLRAMVSIDLSVRRDFSAVTMSWYEERKERMYFHTKYFFPKGALPGHPCEKIYRAWAEKGHLHLQDGDVIDYDEIAAYIIELTECGLVLGIGYDPYRSRQLLNTLEAIPDVSGVSNSLCAVRQTNAHFTSAVEAFEYGVMKGSVVIDDNPINAYCFGNAVLDIDSNENCKPVKRMESQRIDGVITKLMCMRMWLDLEQHQSYQE